MVEFISGIHGVDSFTVFIDLRLLKIHKRVGDLLFHFVMITHCFPKWIPRKCALNYFKVIALKLQWKSEEILIDFYRIWDFNGYLLCDKDDSIYLRSVMDGFWKRIQIVNSLVVEREE
jgi:hypothetical protein